MKNFFFNLMIISIFITTLISCETHSNENSMVSTKKRTEINSKSIKVIKGFNNNGILKIFGHYRNNIVLGYIRRYDKHGELNSLVKYKGPGVLSEKIQFDSVGSIDYSKSFFLSTIPNSINDTIYYSIKKSNTLEMRLLFYNFRQESYRIIIEYSNKSDTLFANNMEWINYSFKNLKEGSEDINFFIKSKLKEERHETKYYLYSESRRVIKISK